MRSSAQQAQNYRLKEEEYHTVEYTPNTEKLGTPIHTGKEVHS